MNACADEPRRAQVGQRRDWKLVVWWCAVYQSSGANQRFHGESARQQTPLSDALDIGSNKPIRLISEYVRRRVFLCALERPSTNRVWGVAIEYTRNSLVFLNLLLD